ncbi:MAG: methylamine utilization protein [Pseudomonadales bacterium]|nr:methylamine utilization protein [Pseudomonadales bacterium]
MANLKKYFYPHLLLALLCSVGFAASAKEFSFKVLTVDNKPLADAVVWLTPATTNPAKTNHDGIMDQVHKTFVPYILPIQVGTTVDFPNSDSINHHVYSFSPAKRFELKLSPSHNSNHSVLFDKAGIVTLGCNIHDWMLAYIVVLDTPYFAQTDNNGLAKIELPNITIQEGQFWHPQINDAPEQLKFTLNKDEMILRLTKPLKPDLRRSAHGYR